MNLVASEVAIEGAVTEGVTVNESEKIATSNEKKRHSLTSMQQVF